MAKCKHCGNHEKTKFNLSGFICSNCRPNCIKESCSSANLASEQKSVDTEDYGEIVWCYSCGQIIPVEHVQQDCHNNPVNGLPNDFNKEEYLGLTIHDIPEGF